jgi:hypothetical protein
LLLQGLLYKSRENNNRRLESETTKIQWKAHHAIQKCMQGLKHIYIECHPD